MAEDPGATTIFTVMTALAEETGAVNLGQGFPDEDGPSAIIEAAVEALRSGTKNQYAPLPGVPPLREAIADHQHRWYGVTLDPATQVQVTFGATEGLASALLAVVRPGDEVLALDPMYDAYSPVTRMAGGAVKPVFLEPPDWRVTPAALEAAVTDRTRALLLNTPHNPTGRVFDEAELRLLAEVCRERDLVAVTDEVYEHLVYEGRHVPLSVLDGMAERTITVSSVGKTHALTGWKIGWATGPAPLIARVRGVKQFLTFAGGTPLQHAAAVGLGLPDDEVRTAAATLRGKRDRLSAGLREVGFDVFPTEGTYFLNADARPLGYESAEELCTTLPHDAAVVAIPVSAFSAAPDGPLRPIVRFAFCKRDDVLDEGITRLKKWAAARPTAPA